MGNIRHEDLRTCADTLARRLDALSRELSPSERGLLAVLFVRAMNPLERMRYLDPSGLLSPAEMRVLGGLPATAEE